MTNEELKNVDWSNLAIEGNMFDGYRLVIKDKAKYFRQCWEKLQKQLNGRTIRDMVGPWK